MTISSKNAWGSAVGGGTTGPFAVPFVLYNQTHLQVLQVTNNVPTIMNLGTDYTFTSWVPDTKGQVANPEITFTNVVAGGVEIIFRLALPGTQLTSITNFGDFFPGMHEMTFDELTQFMNQLNEWAVKSIKAPDQEWSGNGVNLTLPPIAQRSSTYLAIDALGNIECLSNLTFTGVPILTSYAFAALPAQTGFALAVCTDGPFAVYNPFNGGWNKVSQVGP